MGLIITPAASGGGGYVLYGGAQAQFSPLDSTTYYFGSGPITATALISWSRQRIYVPKAGTITQVSIHVDNASGATSGESVSHYVRLNDATDTTLSTSAVWPAANVASDFNYTTSIAVAAGDYIAPKVVTPAWATNPVGIAVRVQFYIE